MAKSGIGQISDAFVAGACQRLKDAKPVRREIQPWGRLHIDRPLPFLVVYRRPKHRADPETHRIVLGEASYLLAPGDRQAQRGLAALIEGVATTLSQSFGAFLIIEFWSAEQSDADRAGTPKDAQLLPGFRIVRPRESGVASTIEVLDRALCEVKIKGEYARVDVVSAATVHPPGMAPLISAERALRLGVRVLGIEVQPVYRDAATGEGLPLVGRALHKGVALALKRTVYEFTRRRTSHRPAHYQALGRHSMVKAVWEVDCKLAEVSSEFDFLLQVTPINPKEAWTQFRRRRFHALPEFSSRPLKLDPALAKRRLFQIPIERIEDPTLGQLFRDQQVELDRKLSMLGDRGTPLFLYGSLQLYGGVDESLLSIAHEVLERVPSRSRDESTRGAADARTFAARASQEIAYYRNLHPEVHAKVEIRTDVTGLMVSRGNLLIGAETRVPLSRIEALIAHEIGTHIVTYVNGRAQPFRQLYVGLPGYDELQEGIAVLSEYLVGGFSRPRLRLLAARVVAVARMVAGADFIEVFRELRDYEFTQRTAFTIAMRVFRGGGLTKDAVYLRGLVDLLAYLRGGGALEPLLVGKLGANHVPMIEELQWRKVLVPPPLRPRHLDDPSAALRLASVRNGLGILDLVRGARR